MRAIDLERLRRIGDAFLDSARNQLTATGNLTPVVVLCDPIEGPDRVVGIDPEFLASPGRKQFLAAEIKKLVAIHGYTAVATLFDTESLSIPDSDRPRLLELRSLGYGSRQIHSLFGMGEYSEAVDFAVERIDGRHFKMVMRYDRVPVPGPALETPGVEFRFREVEYREDYETDPDISLMKFFGGVE
jgi:hypothetical protein